MPINLRHQLNFYVGTMVAEVVNTSILVKNTSGTLACIVQHMFGLLISRFNSLLTLRTCYWVFWKASIGRLQFMVCESVVTTTNYSYIFRQDPVRLLRRRVQTIISLSTTDQNAGVIMVFTLCKVVPRHTNIDLNPT